MILLLLYIQLFLLLIIRTDMFLPYIFNSLHNNLSTFLQDIVECYKKYGFICWLFLQSCIHAIDICMDDLQYSSIVVYVFIFLCHTNQYLLYHILCVIFLLYLYGCQILIIQVQMQVGVVIVIGVGCRGFLFQLLVLPADLAEFLLDLSIAD